MNNLSRYGGGGLPREVRQELSASHHDALVTLNRIQDHAVVGHVAMGTVAALSTAEASFMRACPRGAARIEAVCEASCAAIGAEVIKLAIQR